MELELEEPERVNFPLMSSYDSDAYDLVKTVLLYALA